MGLLDDALAIEAEHGTVAAFPNGFAAFVTGYGLPRAWDTVEFLGGPTELPAQRDATMIVARVDRSGRAHLKGMGTTITVGADRVGQQVTIIIDDNHVNAHDDQGVFLGHLLIEWGRPHQGKLHDAA